MLKLYVKVYSAIDPDEELVVGSFVGRKAREFWCVRRLPVLLQELSRELGVRQIDARTERCSFIRSEVPPSAIKPGQLVDVVRRQYRDLYQTF